MQCKTKYAIYQRITAERQERFDINFRNGMFSYHADSSNLVYNAKGKLELIDSVLYLEFPENAETFQQSPFKKGFSELVKLNESDQIEIEVFNFDVRTKGKLSPSRHFSPTIELVSLLDSTVVRKIPYPKVQIPDEENILVRSKVHGYFDQYILIPSKGEYRLNLFLQPGQTIVSYETTATDCYEVVSGPLLQIRASGMENKLFKRLYVEGESYIPYSQVDDPFSLVRIEKRKLRLFN